MINSYLSGIDNEGDFYDYPAFSNMSQYSISRLQEAYKSEVSIRRSSKDQVVLQIGHQTAIFPINILHILNYMCRFYNEVVDIEHIIINALSTETELSNVTEGEVKKCVNIWNDFCSFGELSITSEKESMWIGDIPENTILLGENYRIFERKGVLIMENWKKCEVSFGQTEGKILIKLLSKRGQMVEYGEIFRFMNPKWTSEIVRNLIGGIDQKIQYLGCNLKLQENPFVGYKIVLEDKERKSIPGNVIHFADYIKGPANTIVGPFKRNVINILEDLPGNKEEDRGGFYDYPGLELMAAYTVEHLTSITGLPFSISLSGTQEYTMDIGGTKFELAAEIILILNYLSRFKSRLVHIDEIIVNGLSSKERLSQISPEEVMNYIKIWNNTYPGKKAKISSHQNHVWIGEEPKEVLLEGNDFTITKNSGKIRIQNSRTEASIFFTKDDIKIIEALLKKKGNTLETEQIKRYIYGEISPKKVHNKMQRIAKKIQGLGIEIQLVERAFIGYKLVEIKSSQEVKDIVIEEPSPKNPKKEFFPDPDTNIKVASNLVTEESDQDYPFPSLQEAINHSTEKCQLFFGQHIEIEKARGKNRSWIKIQGKEAEFGNNTIKIFNYLFRYLGVPKHSDDIIIEGLSTIHEISTVVNKGVEAGVKEWNDFCPVEELQIHIDDLGEYYMGIAPKQVLFVSSHYEISESGGSVSIENTRAPARITLEESEGKVLVKILSEAGKLVRHREILEILNISDKNTDITPFMEKLCSKLGNIGYFLNIQADMFQGYKALMTINERSTINRNIKEILGRLTTCSAS